MHEAIQVTVQPAEYVLEQNYPNPFNPLTTIRFSLKEAGEVSLTVVNMQGQIVRTLVSNKMEAGIHELHWDAMNDAGIPMPSGNYFCILKANGFNKTMQMILLK
jgi:flagellar hook assembly protein FlgD